MNSKFNWQHIDLSELDWTYVGPLMSVQEEAYYFVLHDLQPSLIGLGKAGVPRRAGIIKMTLDE